MKSALRAVAAVMVLVLFLAFAGVAIAQGVSVPGTRSGFITTSDGTKIHYLEAGKGSAILFVPGWTMPAWIWEHQIAHFAKAHRVIAMDPRGQGESSKPREGYFPAARARDIKAVVDQLKLAPVVLVAWSMGVTEVGAYVDQFGTDTVAGIVLVDGVVGLGDDPATKTNMLQFASAHLVDRTKAVDGFVRFMYRKPQTEEYIARVKRAALKTPTDAALALFVGMVVADYRGTLPRINRPTLIAAAGDEKSNPWVARYMEMQKAIPGARLEKFVDAGHALFVDDPARFNSLLDQFIASLPR